MLTDNGWRGRLRPCELSVRAIWGNGLSLGGAILGGGQIGKADKKQASSAPPDRDGLLFVFALVFPGWVEEAFAASG
jgi:hypothetical protein